MPWPDDFATCAPVFNICLPNDFSAGCLGRIIFHCVHSNVSHMLFWAKQVYVWGFLSAFGKERVQKLCWVSWPDNFTFMISDVSLVLLFLFTCLPPNGFSARCLGWMIMLPIWGLCLWICLPQVCLAWCRVWMILLDMCLLLDFVPSICFSLSVFLCYSYTFHMDWH